MFVGCGVGVSVGFVGTNVVAVGVFEGIVVGVQVGGGGGGVLVGGMAVAVRV